MSGMSDFRRGATHDANRKSPRSGGGNRKFLFERYTMSERSIYMLFVRGKFIDPDPPEELIELDANGQRLSVELPHYKFRQHTHSMKAKKRWLKATCSAGWNGHNQLPCVGCSAMDMGSRAVNLADKYAFTFLHLGFQHGHPWLDKETHQIKTKDDGSPIILHDECLWNIGSGSRDCNFCRVLTGQAPIIDENHSQNPWDNWRGDQLSTVFGRRRFLELGKNGLQDLITWDATIGSKCGNMLGFTDPQGQPVQMPCGQALLTDGYACPYCEAVVIDLGPGGDQRSLEQIRQAVLYRYPCHNCRRSGLLNELVSCPRCGPVEPRTIFDVVVKAKKVGEDTNTHLILEEFYSLEEFESVIMPREFGIQGSQTWFHGKTFREWLAEAAKPYEFEKIYEAQSLQEQAKVLQLPMPPQGGVVAPSYGQAPAAGPGGYGAPVPAPGNYGAPPAPGYGAPPMGPPSPGGAAPGGYGAPPAPPPYSTYPNAAPAPAGPPGYTVPPTRPMGR
jgi:hypothetical protein